MPQATGIYLRGNVYWFAVQKNKKRHFISLGTSDFSEAVKKASRIRHDPDLESGSILPNAIKRFIAHKERVEARGDKGGWAKATVSSKRYVLEHFATFCGNLTPSQVTAERVKAYHGARMSETSAQTAYGNLMTVRSFFNWCRSEERTIRENPCDKLKIHAPHSNARKDFCTPEQVEKLIAECPRDDLKFVLFCGFHAGMRALEIVEAVPWWFDLKAKQIHLRKTPTIKFKDREERSLPLSTAFADFLACYGLREPFMLHPENAKHGKNRYRYDFRRPFTLYMREQGMEWVTPHIMRHTFSSLLASSGENIYTIAVWLGDDVRVVQKHYAKLLPIRGAIDTAFQSTPLNLSQAMSSKARS